MTPVLWWMSISIPFMTISISIGYVYLAFEKTKYRAYMAGIYMVAILLSLMVLTPKYGLQGAGMSMLIASIIMLLSNPFPLGNLLYHSMLGILVRIFLIPVVASIVMLYSIHGYTNNLSDFNLFTLLNSMIIGGLIYAIIAYLLVLISPVNKKANEFMVSLIIVRIKNLRNRLNWS